MAFSAFARVWMHRLCNVLGVSESGYFAWKDRPASRRQREDVVLLAHVRSTFSLSNGTYGSPRMTRELQDDGFAVGRRRTARLMRENDLHARQKQRFKRTTDSHHSWPIAPNIIDQDFAASSPTRNGEPTSPISGLARAVRPPRRRLGCRWPSAPRSRPGRSSQSPDDAASVRGADPPFRPRQPVLLDRLSGRTAPAWRARPRTRSARRSR
jgi:transposase InsO family protein